MLFIRSESQSDDAKRLWAVDQLTSLVRNGAIPREDKWILSVLEFFVIHGFFSVVKKNPKSSLQAVSISDFSKSAGVLNVG